MKSFVDSDIINGPGSITNRAREQLTTPEPVLPQQTYF